MTTWRKLTLSPCPTPKSSWSRREDIKAELKVDLSLTLAEHGYPPVPKDEVFKEIFEQAENFKKYREEFTTPNW